MSLTLDSLGFGSWKGCAPKQTVKCHALCETPAVFRTGIHYPVRQCTSMTGRPFLRLTDMTGLGVEKTSIFIHSDKKNIQDMEYLRYFI